MTVVTEFPDAADAPLPPQATHPMEEFREAPEEPMAAAPVAAEEALTPAVTEAEETPPRISSYRKVEFIYRSVKLTWFYFCKYSSLLLTYRIVI